MKLSIYSDHPWSQREHVAIPDLAGEKLLMLKNGHYLHDQAMGLYFQVGARTRIPTFRATSLETLRNMVAAGKRHHIAALADSVAVAGA